MNTLHTTRCLAISIGPARSLRSASALAQTEAKVNVTESEKPFSEIPRPGKLKFMRAFMPGGEFYNASVTEYASMMRKRYGDVYIMPGMFGRKDWVTTFNTKDIEMVFRNEGIWPRRDGLESIVYFRRHVRPDVYGEVQGLVASQGEDWGKLRSAVNPIFMQPRGLRMYYEPLSNINNEFIERIKEIRDSKTLEVPEDFYGEISRLAFESLALVGFDRQMGLIRKNRENPDALTLFKTTREIFQLAFSLDFQPSMWKVVSTPAYRRMKKALNDSLDVAHNLLKETQDNIEKRRLDGEKINNNSMLERLMVIDPKIAVIMGLDILFAGVDATSTLLSAVFLALAKHPEKQAKLREELLQIMPTKDTLLNEENMKDMPYLRAVIKETLRYFPNGLGTLRTCQSDVVLSGYKVPAGTTVLMGANVLMKDGAYYTRPDEFLPERWLRDPETGKKMQVSPFTFLPFGFGPRMCIGKRLVDLEVETTVAKIVRNFHLEFNRDASRPFKTLFVMEPAIPFPFKFTDVEQ
ncbi:probable cytochrome P450 12d1 proximal, mitochondrial [Drosophila bipectinata]|uniref:probable cytochrome P450 12d1 proximal, mitochondrial n=1 Tax=Drosophila bipectinata TaxID=42026 RepID=UPI001C8AAF75|nr:probable cytochrome P450 12d1 proximal, mitochondrial [Drosophila bipectinata]